MRIQHNIMAMNAYRNYNNNTSALSKNLEKLSSGYKINRAGDDAAGLAISEKMRAQITGLDQAQDNAQSGINLVQTAEGALQEVHDMLNRMVKLADQSANGTYDNEVDRDNLQQEVDQLKSEINRIADSANYNGINLLDGNLAGSNISGDLAITNSKVTTSVATASAALATSNALVDGDKISYTVSWKNADGTENSKTITLTADVTNDKLVAEDGTEYSMTAAGAATAGELDTAFLSELKKDTSVTSAFDVTSDKGGKFTFTSKVSGADGAVVTALSVAGKITGGAIAANPTVGKDSTQVLDFSNIDVVASGAVASDEDIANAIFEVGGQKFVFTENGTTAGDLKNLDADVHVIELDGQTYDAGDDAANVAAELSRVTGMNFEVDTAGDTGAGIAANSVLYKGDETLAKGGQGLTLQIGDTSDTFNQLTVAIQDMHASSLGIDGIDISTQEGAQAAVDVIKAAINTVSSVRGTLGATQNRLDHTINNLSVMQENIQDAESTIRDTDVADEMMAYTKNNILVQSAQAMLAQANQVPQGVLQLLQ